MSSVSFSELHDRVATQVATVSTYTEALWPLDPTGSADSIADKVFSIVIEPTIERLSRAQSGELSLIDSNVRVMFLAQMNPLDQITSHRAALDDALSIIQAIMAQAGAAWNDGLRVRYTGGPIAQRLAGGDFLLYELRFNIRHSMTL